MKTETTAAKTDSPKTLAEFCGIEQATLNAYFEQKDGFLKKLDEKAQARVACALEKKLAWVA